MPIEPWYEDDFPYPHLDAPEINDFDKPKLCNVCKQRHTKDEGCF